MCFQNCGNPNLGPDVQFGRSSSLACMIERVHSTTRRWRTQILHVLFSLRLKFQGHRHPESHPRVVACSCRFSTLFLKKCSAINCVMFNRKMMIKALGFRAPTLRRAQQRFGVPGHGAHWIRKRQWHSHAGGKRLPFDNLVIQPCNM